MVDGVAGSSFVPDPYDVPIERLDPGDARLFQHGAELGYFARLRREDPVHYTADHPFGPYWSVTRYDDIVAVDTNHEDFSSRPAITLADADEDFPLPSLIAMDPPQHEAHRRVVQPVASASSLAGLEPLIRERTARILDGLPGGEVVDWVDRVAVEITTATLATLLGFPQSERRQLARWADAATTTPGLGALVAEAERRAELQACMTHFAALREERATRPRGADLLSALVHDEATAGMSDTQFLGAIVLLLVAGSDTTRSALSGSVMALVEHPDQQRALFADPSLVAAMAPEILRWQTPAVHMRRTARRTVELGGKRIRRGEKVVMWYFSGNRDEAVFDRANDFWIGRPNARRHLSFGSGIDYCLGARLGELQLRIVWEEVLRRFAQVELAGEPVRYRSNFMRGFERLPVRLTRR